MPPTEPPLAQEGGIGSSSTMTSIELVRARVASACYHLGLRALRMGSAWLVVGAVVGLCNGLRLGGHGVVIAGQVIAGMIVFPVLGVTLALIVDTAVESLAGLGFGLLIGTLTPLLGSHLSRFEHLTLAATIGALIGATSLPWLRLVLRFTGRLAGAGKQRTAARLNS